MRQTTNSFINIDKELDANILVMLLLFIIALRVFRFRLFKQQIFLTK